MQKFTTLIGVLLVILTIGLKSHAQIVINEYSVSNLNSFTDNFGQNEDWFELYNLGSSSTDLGGYFLSDDTTDLFKWQFPEGSMVTSHGFARVWATGRDLVSGSHYHTNFRLSQTKDKPEFIVLTDQDGNILDYTQLQITQKEHSRGRTNDGSVSWSIFCKSYTKRIQ